jgi:hypothetical protein
MACKGSSARIDHAYQVDRYDARNLCPEAGVAYLVVVGEDGTCRCPFGSDVKEGRPLGRHDGAAAKP